MRCVPGLFDLGPGAYAVRRLDLTRVFAQAIGLVGEGLRGAASVRTTATTVCPADAMRSFVLPDLGEGLREAEIVAWHVDEGDLVDADDPLVTVETDKAVTDIPAPWAGRLLRLHGRVGDRVAVGASLAEYDLPAIAGTVAPAGDGTRSAMPASLPPRPSGVTAMPAVRALAVDLGLDLGAIAGTGPRMGRWRCATWPPPSATEPASSHWPAPAARWRTQWPGHTPSSCR